jgi:hypothetical protein
MIVICCFAEGSQLLISFVYKNCRHKNILTVILNHPSVLLHPVIFFTFEEWTLTLAKLCAVLLRLLRKLKPRDCGSLLEEQFYTW